jgi:REP element-mobilizing transposase RayT
MRQDVPSLRSERLVRETRRSLVVACERGEFRVVHYSIQRDHVHMIVEARGREALARGMKSIAARLARAVNRVFSRSGPVLDGRFHHRVLRTPREVRNALAYVLLNARRHFAKRSGGRRPPVRLDVASSARWFDGWKQAWRSRLGPPDEEPGALREVARARTWLLRVGGRRHGLVDPCEVPGVRRATCARRSRAATPARRREGTRARSGLPPPKPSSFLAGPLVDITDIAIHQSWM